MPLESFLNGMHIKTYFLAEGINNKEYIEVTYLNDKATLNFYGNLLIGKIPDKQKKQVMEWFNKYKMILISFWMSILEEE